MAAATACLCLAVNAGHGVRLSGTNKAVYSRTEPLNPVLNLSELHLEVHEVGDEEENLARLLV